MQTQTSESLAIPVRSAHALRLGGVFALIACAFVLVAYSKPGLAADPSDDFPPPGTLIEVGAHRLHLHCMGAGSPTVVMDAGLGGNSVDWIQVQPGLSDHARVCTYDRAGNGWSEPGPLPRTSERIADELHTLLAKAGVAPPYVLVGHSFGGYNVRLFANQFPAKTAGLVLVDASHEEQFTRFRQDGIGVNTAPRGHFILRSIPQVPEGMPESSRALSHSLLSRVESTLAVRAELSSFLDSARQVQQAGLLPDVPLIVITRGKRLYPDNAKGNRMENLWQEMQIDLVQLTSQGEQVVAEHSGHYVHLDEPQVVIDGIRQVIARHRNRLASSPSLTMPPQPWQTKSDATLVQTAARE